MQLQEKAQKEVVLVRQRLDEALSQEKRSLRCELIKKRRELISNTVRKCNAQNTVTAHAAVLRSRPLSGRRQLRVHRQREKELSVRSKALEGRTEVAQHLQRWQNLLTAHSLQLAELINNLDEEAATDIRKVHFTHSIVAYPADYTQTTTLWSLVLLWVAAYQGVFPGHCRTVMLCGPSWLSL